MNLLERLKEVAPDDWKLILYLISQDSRISRHSERADVYRAYLNFWFQFPQDKYDIMWSITNTLGRLDPEELYELVKYFLNIKRPSIFKSNSVTE